MKGGYAQHKANVPKPNATIIRTQAFEFYVIKCGYKNWHKKHVFKSDWTMCSKYTNHSRFNSPHDRREGGGQCMTT